MFTVLVEHAAEIDDAWPVEQESLDRRSPDWRKANDEREVAAPREVFLPLHLSRVKEWCYLAGRRVRRLHLVIFMVVAPLAGQSQVVWRTCAAVSTGTDVLDGKRLGGVLCLATAVLTAVMSACFYQTAYLPRDT